MELADERRTRAGVVWGDAAMVGGSSVIAASSAFVLLLLPRRDGVGRTHGALHSSSRAAVIDATSRSRKGESSGGAGSNAPPLHATTNGVTTSGAITMRFGPRAPAATSAVDGVGSTVTVSRLAPSTTS